MIRYTRKRTQERDKALKTISGGSEGPRALRSEFVSPGFAGRAGSLRPWAQTIPKHLSEKIAAGELFRHTQER